MSKSISALRNALEPNPLERHFDFFSCPPEGHVLSQDEFKKDGINKIYKITEQRQTSIGESVREVQERDEREKNLMFFNIEESQAEEALDRITEDSKKIESILQKIQVEGCDFEKPVRVGRKGEAPRPLKIRFKESDSCNKILKSTKKLKGTDIYISRDMTPLERKQWKALLEERDKKRQEAKEQGLEEKEALWIIRRGKVINVARDGPRQPQGQAKDM
ncbi:hypothetical protein EGW08_023827 [Elysia chlorotica]|uniref:Uncharacterized protein n=1 Tax=Elysia chlorotica TaxID=188477 RepID=A0A3S1APR9_ELYCH|nr:hypothetical protein EGW08_023827 [Elysia chlorotica]